MKLPVASALLLSLTLVPLLQAEDPAKPAPPTSPAAASSSKPEAGKWDPKEAFAKRDANGDGAISFEEFKTGRRAQRNPEKAADYFKRKDLDGNGSLSLDEFKARLPETPEKKSE